MRALHYFLGSVIVGGAVAAEFLREDRQRIMAAVRDFAEHRLRDATLKQRLSEVVAAYEKAFALAPPASGLSGAAYDQRITSQREAAREGQVHISSSLARMAALELSAW